MNVKTISVSALALMTGLGIAVAADVQDEQMRSGIEPGARTLTPDLSDREKQAAETEAYRQWSAGMPQQSRTGQPDQQQTQSSTQTGNPADDAELTFYTVQPTDRRASKLIGATVYNLNNDNIGKVEDLIVDSGNTIRAVIVSVGGFLGMGERNIALERKSLTLTQQPDGTTRVVVNTTRDALQNAPAVRDKGL
jgi:hypothetical protein